MCRAIFTEACTDTFKAYADKNAQGASSYDKATTLGECQAQCLSMEDCVAVDWSPTDTTSKCWIHTDAQQAAQLKDAVGVTHHAREKCNKSGE